MGCLTQFKKHTLQERLPLVALENTARNTRYRYTVHFTLYVYQAIHHVCAAVGPRIQVVYY